MRDQDGCWTYGLGTALSSGGCHRVLYGTWYASFLRPATRLCHHTLFPTYRLRTKQEHSPNCFSSTRLPRGVLLPNWKLFVCTAHRFRMCWRSTSRVAHDHSTFPLDNTAPTGRVGALTSHHTGRGVTRVGPSRTPTVHPCSSR